MSRQSFESPRSLFRIGCRIAIIALPVALAAIGSTLLTSRGAQANAAVPVPLPPPTPFELISQLDFECRRSAGPSPAANVFVRQLNPVLKDRLPNQLVVFEGLEETCVPVAKNNDIPSPVALRFARWIDVACYAVDAPPVDVDVTLSQLNPHLAHLADENVKLVQLEQVCLPVRKNASDIPADVRQFVSHFDLGCYRLEEPTADAKTTLLLSHLNPVIQDLGIPPHVVEMHRARQLCVPIAKNDQPVPDGIRAIVEWADFLKYRLDGAVPAFPLQLQHLNPLYAGVPPFGTWLLDQPRLLVPVAKDGHFPPME